MSFEPFYSEGRVLKTCESCREDRPISWYVIEDGEELSTMCCHCEGGHADDGLNLEERPYGKRLADGFALLGGDE